MQLAKAIVNNYNVELISAFLTAYTTENGDYTVTSFSVKNEEDQVSMHY